MFRNFLDVIKDKEFKIVLGTDFVDVINYIDIVNFDFDDVTIKFSDRLLKIKGNNLVIDKLLNDEVLIKGEIKKIEIV